MTETMTRPKAPLTLHERLALVAQEVGKVAATGKTPFGQAAISISDVEDAIRLALAAHGVITRWADVEAPVQLAGGGREALWLRHMRVIIASSDSNADRIEDEWWDVGSNPMAASSFARKGYYKALFHLAEASDEGQPRTTPSLPEQPRTVQTGAAHSPAPERVPCQSCARQGWTNKKGYPSVFWADRPTCDGWGAGGYANHPRAERQAVAAGMDGVEPYSSEEIEF